MYSLGSKQEISYNKHTRDRVWLTFAFYFDLEHMCCLYEREQKIKSQWLKAVSIPFLSLQDGSLLSTHSRNEMPSQHTVYQYQTWTSVSWTESLCQTRKPIYKMEEQIYYTIKQSSIIIPASISIFLSHFQLTIKMITTTTFESWSLSTNNYHDWLKATCIKLTLYSVIFCSKSSMAFIVS